MAGPFIVVIAGTLTAWIAIGSADGLVDDDYYKQGLAVNQRLERDQKAVDLGVKIEAMIGTDGQALRVVLSAHDGMTLPDKIHLRLTHPTQSGRDQRVELSGDGHGFYSGRLVEAVQGRWYVAIEDAARTWRVNGEWNVSKQQTLRMPAA